MTATIAITIIVYSMMIIVIVNNPQLSLVASPKITFRSWFAPYVCFYRGYLYD